MQQKEFRKTILRDEKKTLSRILVVYGENYFGEVTSPLIIQKFADPPVIIELTKLENERTDIKLIVSYLQEQGYTIKADC